MSNETAERHLGRARENLLAPGGIGDGELEKVFDQLMVAGVDASDLYFQRRCHEAWVMEDGIIREASSNQDQGVGVRAISGAQSGFAYSDELAMPALVEAARAARAIARTAGSGHYPVPGRGHRHALYDAANPVASMNANDKVALLKEADAAARGEDSRVEQISVSLVGVHDTVLIADSDGRQSADHRPLVRLSVHVVAVDGDRREVGASGGGGRLDYRYFADSGLARAYAREAVRRALVNLEAEAAPAGTMPVVLGPGWPGVLLHEAVGHGLEGDFNRKGSSAFAGRRGERVASSLCSVVDDGTLARRRGSLNIDDEGQPTACNTLIEEGILTGYMQDRLNAALMGEHSTGNARRESYAHLPMPRMTNTYMLPGRDEPNDIVASVDRGIYAANFGGGQVDITSGQFVFSASEAYLIERGRITRPVKGATLIGHGPDVLNRVSMVGHDLALDDGIGTCGKQGQSVPVGVGQPTVLVDALTVGGTQA
jgi:TldD protein